MNEKLTKLTLFVCCTVCAFAGFIFGGTVSEMRAISKCAESAETTRMQACVRAGGSWVSGNCVGPLPAPEGK